MRGKMTVKEMVDILNTFPCDTEVAVIYPDDIYGEEGGVPIGEITYLTSTSRERAKNGVFIRLS